MRFGAECDRLAGGSRGCGSCHTSPPRASQGQTRTCDIAHMAAGMKGPNMSQDRPKSKNIACGDVVPGCGFTAEAATEAELIAQVAAHAAHEHGVKEITPELAEKVKAAIRTQ